LKLFVYQVAIIKLMSKVIRHHQFKQYKFNLVQWRFIRNRHLCRCHKL